MPDAEKPKPGADATLAPLARATERDYCRAALGNRHSEFWWYFTGLASYRGFSRPFVDPGGRWWYFVKPRFAWPVDFFRPLEGRPPSLFFITRLGQQWPVSAAESNSVVWMNVIHDLRGYGLDRIDTNKRRAVRSGLKSLLIEQVDPADPTIAAAACEIWNSHVERTGWNSRMSRADFTRSWAELAGSPGTTVFATRQRSDGLMCSWLIARIIDDTAYVDTIASHTERLAARPNDTIIFHFLSRAAAEGVLHAHYSLKSRLAGLEAFKQSLGFEAYAFPARLQLRFPVGPIIRIARPQIWKRLHGHADWAEDSSPPPPAPAGQRAPH